MSGISLRISFPVTQIWHGRRSHVRDLSLAGSRAGLAGSRSGSFWGFWRLIEALKEQNRHPRTIVLENVYGAVSSNGGRDFLALLDALGSCHYSAGALVIDAVHFVPQSRPRLFIVAVREDLTIPDRLVMSGTHPM